MHFRLAGNNLLQWRYLWCNWRQDIREFCGIFANFVKSWTSGDNRRRLVPTRPNCGNYWHAASLPDGNPRSEADVSSYLCYFLSCADEPTWNWRTAVAARDAQHWPSGSTFTGVPASRMCDGSSSPLKVKQSNRTPAIVWLVILHSVRLFTFRRRWDGRRRSLTPAIVSQSLNFQPDSWRSEMQASLLAPFHISLSEESSWPSGHRIRLLRPSHNWKRRLICRRPESTSQQQTVHLMSTEESVWQGPGVNAIIVIFRCPRSARPPFAKSTSDRSNNYIRRRKCPPSGWNIDWIVIWWK